eukprot:6746620-Prymnesium_polylepis.1
MAKLGGAADGSERSVCGRACWVEKFGRCAGVPAGWRSFFFFLDGWPIMRLQADSGSDHALAKRREALERPVVRGGLGQRSDTLTRRMISTLRLRAGRQSDRHVPRASHGTAGRA